jgi:hypothetical protein
MTTNVREFLRHFAAFRAKASRGESIRIRDRAGEFVFAAAGPRRTLLGAARGKIKIHGALTKPTARDGLWQPSL